MTIHRFYVPSDQIAGSSLAIRGADAEQIRRVLRLEPGAEIEAFDGSGRQFRAVLASVLSGEVLADIRETSHPRTEPLFAVRLAQALLKGEKTDWVVEKAVELGATSIILFAADRSVPQIREDRSARKRERWERIAKEAAEQCGRVRIPEIALSAGLEDALDSLGDGRIYIADEALARENASGGAHAGDEDLSGGAEVEGGGWNLRGAPEALNSPREPDDPIRRYERESFGAETRSLHSLSSPLALLIGPEGGWSERERQLSLRRGAVRISLGPRILRAETAGIVALARFVL